MKMESLMQARHERQIAVDPLMVTPEFAAAMRPELATLCGDDDKATIRNLQQQIWDLKRIKAQDTCAFKLHRAFTFVEQEPSTQRDRFSQYQRGSSHMQAISALPIENPWEDQYEEDYAPLAENGEPFFDEEWKAKFQIQRRELEKERQEANDMQHGF